MFYAIHNSKRPIAAAVMAALVAGATVSPASAAGQEFEQLDRLTSQPMPAFLEEAGATALSPTEMKAIQGEGWPIALYYAVMAAPTLHTLLYSSIANHFPVMLIKDAWRSLRR